MIPWKAFFALQLYYRLNMAREDRKYVKSLCTPSNLIRRYF